MKQKTISAMSLILLVIIGLIALILAFFAQSVSWRFLLALYPLLVILFGVAFLRQSGLTMAFAGLIITMALAIFQFGTSTEVALGSSVYGFLKSFGISISVAATMLMIFLMREAGALATVSKVIKQQVVGEEVQALYIGIGFGSFLTSLGVVTPALFPPLLVAMGFTPISAIAIAVLGYDPTTSFSLLSIPITLPAEVGGTIGIPINPIEFAFKIAIFLPLISTGFAFAILWLVGGKPSMRKAAVPAIVCGLALALACLGTVSLDYFSGVEYVPLRIVGVIAGLCAMISLYAYQKLNPQATRQKAADYPSRNEIFRSFSPWIILTMSAAVVSVPQIGKWLSDVLGGLEKIIIFADQIIDFDFLSQIYTWIFVAILLSIFTLRMTRKQVRNAASFWLKRFLGPFLAYSLYFSIAFVMANSAKTIEGGALIAPPASYNMLNMNVILGSTLAAVFGAGYIFVAASLGLFGAVVGGSETSSNVLFLKIQNTAANNIGLNDKGFMTVYGSHAVAGGIASAITPAKINNAVVTIDEKHETESFIMRRHLIIALLLTIATGILTGIFVNLNI
ncbi:L-lactate permease [Candidatus Bathyarchaeota archaeon]|nr:L-lactate permease [Candidatus Bathyarchaeota archaeon]